MKKAAWLIIIIILISLSCVVYRTFRGSIWDGKNRINVALNQNPVTVLSLSPKDQKLVMLTIPSGTYIETINGYGFYKIQSIYPLGELDNKGGELLSGSLEEYLGIPIDGYLSVKPCVSLEVREKKICLLKQLRTSLFSAQQTDLSKWDILRLWWGVNQIRLSKINVSDLCQNQLCEEVMLPDGSKVWQLDSDSIDKISANLFADPQIKNEGLSIALLNGTSHYGLANRGARILTNLGVAVLKISDWDNKLSVCEIRAPKSLTESYTFKKTQNLFNCRWQEDDLKEHRVDILLILGEYYWDRLSKKKEGC